ncbi:MAG: OmpA family protein [Sulfurovum sp.]|nr:OmpA family protein [Sulfurovum sp.]
MITMLALSTLIMTACTQKAPDLGGEEGKNNISDSVDIANDTVTIDENKYGNENTDTVSESKYNSSSDGFQSIYFDFGDYSISSEMENHITSNTNIVNSESNTIKIEGNCDEFGTDEYNYALGLKRAKSVKDAIAAQGVSESKMVIISYGESSPTCSSPTDSCYEKNRRVDLRLVK